MRSDEVNVSLQNIAPALDMIERTADYVGFDSHYAARLRLLGEELIRSAGTVLDDLDGVMWMDTADGNMCIHLKVEGQLSEEKRQQLAAISKTGKNESPKGVFAKVGAFFADFFMSDVAGYVPSWCECEFSPDQYAVYSLMDPYYDELRRSAASKAAHKDELEGVETSILKGLADDITVSAHGATAELTVSKKLPER